MAKVSSMVSISKANQLRQQVNSEFNEYDQPQTEGKQGVVFFLSFDIVNSTEFKIRAPRNWQILFKEFFQSAIELTQTQEYGKKQEMKSCFTSRYFLANCCQGLFPKYHIYKMNCGVLSRLMPDRWSC
jgi:hypothetical protein